MAAADRKLRSIKEILRNDVYQVDSGLYQRLEEGLNRLPADVLADLAFLVELKAEEARRAAAGEPPVFNPMPAL